MHVPLTAPRGKFRIYLATIMLACASTIVAVFSLTEPALAATSLGGFHSASCTAYANCQLSIYTDSHGNFEIGANVENASAGGYYDVGRGFVHHAAAGGLYTMYIRDDLCDNRGADAVLNYFVTGAHTLKSNGCCKDVQWFTSPAINGVNFRVEFAGGGITFNLPSAIDTGWFPSSAEVFNIPSHSSPC